MKNKITWLLAAAVLSPILAQPAWADQVAIEYALTELGGGRWQYTYDVTNDALVLRIEEFTIWFDFGSFANLTVTTPDPPSSNWDELAVQPDPLLGDDGFYDALSLAGGIDVGQTVSGFAVTFDWLGVGRPGSQRFDVVDPDTFQPIYTGRTTPEPAALALLAIMLTLRRRRPL